MGQEQSRKNPGQSKCPREQEVVAPWLDSEAIFENFYGIQHGILLIFKFFEIRREIGVVQLVRNIERATKIFVGGI